MRFRDSRPAIFPLAIGSQEHCHKLQQSLGPDGRVTTFRSAEDETPPPTSGRNQRQVHPGNARGHRLSSWIRVAWGTNYAELVGGLRLSACLRISHQLLETTEAGLYDEINVCWTAERYGDVMMETSSLAASGY